MNEYLCSFMSAVMMGLCIDIQAYKHYYINICLSLMNLISVVRYNQLIIKVAIKYTEQINFFYI